MGLCPSAYPVGIPVEDGRIFTPVDNLNAFWDALRPDNRGEFPWPDGGDLFGPRFGRTLCGGDRYFRKGHCGQRSNATSPSIPYVRELSLNIFNPGGRFGYSGGPDPLQQKREHADLRYDILDSLPDPDSPVLGEALELIYGSSRSAGERGGRTRLRLRPAAICSRSSTWPSTRWMNSM